MNIFVYGTLLSKMRANDILLEHGAKMIANDKINAKMFTSNFSYPFITLDPAHVVIGEVYEINDKCLRSLDSYEGFDPRGSNALFLRSEVTTLEGGYSVIVYHAGPKIIERMAAELPFHIESGDWRSFVNDPRMNDVAIDYFDKISKLRRRTR